MLIKECVFGCSKNLIQVIWNKYVMTQVYNQERDTGNETVL